METFDRSKWSNCRDCPLSERRRVWSEGPERGRLSIVMIGEAPGRDEESLGHPFVGPAGRTLNYALGRAGVMRRSCWIMNLLPCRLTDNKFDSYEAAEALKCCEQGLQAEIKYLEERGVKVWMPLGNNPCWKTFGITDGITRIRGSVYMNDGKVIIPTFHPSYIQRGQWKQEVTWINDFEKAKRIAGTKGRYRPPTEDFTLFPTIGDVEAFRDAAREGEAHLGCDIEATSLRPDYAEILVVGFALDGSRAISVPFYSQGMHPYWGRSDHKKMLSLLKELLAFPLIFQNCMYDIPVLEAHGFSVPHLADDTLLAHHAIHPELPHTIGYIVSVYGDTPYWKAGVLDRLGALSDVSDEELRTYNLRDCVVLHQVLPGLISDLKEMSTEAVYRKISLPLTRPVMDMTAKGLPLDKRKLASFRTSLRRKHKRLDGKLREVTGVPESFTFDSPDYLRLLIYGKPAAQFRKAKEEFEKYEKPGSKLRRDTKKYKQITEKLEVLRETDPLGVPRGYHTRTRTKGGKLSTAEEALLNLQIAANNRLTLVEKFVRPTDEHELEKKRLRRSLAFYTTYRDYSEVSKLISTYTDFPVWKDGRVHPQYLIHGTRTGRLASRKPNAQNIPKEVRKIFVAPEGYQIMEADYSNLELRVLAYESKDEALIETFEKGENVHDRNTKDLFQIDESHPLWEKARRAAKVYIFGRNYGGGLRGIYRRVVQDVPELSLTFEQFRSVDARYRDKHPRYTQWVRKTLTEVAKGKTLRNAFGRIRIFLGDPNEIEKEGLNFPVQSAAADIINKALLSLYEDSRFHRLSADLVAQVHDALVFEVSTDDIESLGRLLERHMQKRIDYQGEQRIFPVDISVGPNWGSLKELNKCPASSSQERATEKRTSSSRPSKNRTRRTSSRPSRTASERSSQSKSGRTKRKPKPSGARSTA